jgi:hypothetical protein
MDFVKAEVKTIRSPAQPRKDPPVHRTIRPADQLLLARQCAAQARQIAKWKKEWE